jgi:hypothetical protein
LKTSRILALLAFATLASAQTALAPRFDVASIRPSQMARSGGEGSGRENVFVSPTTVALRNASLSFCIQWAYGVLLYQVSGPDWISVPVSTTVS